MMYMQSLILGLSLLYSNFLVNSCHLNPSTAKNEEEKWREKKTEKKWIRKGQDLMINWLSLNICSLKVRKKIHANIERNRWKPRKRTNRRQIVDRCRSMFNTLMKKNSRWIFSIQSCSLHSSCPMQIETFAMFLFFWLCDNENE